MEPKSRGDSNKELKEHPMSEQVIKATHLETSLWGDPDCTLKLLKKTPESTGEKKFKEK